MYDPHPAEAPSRIRGFLLTTVSHSTPSMRSWTSEAHREDELIWSTTGVMRVHAGDAVWTVPAQRGVWVPAGVRHAIEASAETVLHATFVVRGAAPHLPRTATVVEVLPAVRELLLLNAEAPMAEATRMRLQALALELIEPNPSAHVDLRMPDTPRLLAVAERIAQEPSAPLTTEQWAERVGMAPRELSRAFAAETGLSLTQWRIRARVRASLVMLGSGQTVAATARSLGYGSTSVFIAQFRAVIGTTPGAYFADAGQRR